MTNINIHPVTELLNQWDSITATVKGSWELMMSNPESEQFFMDEISTLAGELESMEVVTVLDDDDSFGTDYTISEDNFFDNFHPLTLVYLFSSKYDEYPMLSIPLLKYVPVSQMKNYAPRIISQILLHTLVGHVKPKSAELLSYFHEQQLKNTVTNFTFLIDGSTEIEPEDVFAFLNYLYMNDAQTPEERFNVFAKHMSLLLATDVTYYYTHEVVSHNKIVSLLESKIVSDREYLVNTYGDFPDSWFQELLPR